MKCLNGLVTTAVATLIAGVSTGVSAQPGQVHRVSAAAAADYQPTRPASRRNAGSLHGIVSDEAGGPIAGVTVSAIGETMAFAVTDRRGQFEFDSLPPGQYLLRANRSGFSLPQREYVTVRGSARAVKSLSLRRNEAVQTSGSAQPQILAAGLGGEPAPLVEATSGDGDEAVSPPEPSSPHPHNEAAWRLRHARRTVLKDAGEVVAIADEGAPLEAADFARTPAFSSLFSVLPFSGEINLLTSNIVNGPGDLFGNGLPRGITYVQLGNGGDSAAGWAVQAAVSEGDVSSWIVAGSFSARGPRAHAFDMGLSFGAQEYADGNPALMAFGSNSYRRVGAVYGFDNWAVSPRVHLSYGARLARYDYVNREDLWSPRVALSLNVAPSTHVRATVSQRMRAPGAEEFLPPQAGGPWIPPERTFSALDGDDFRVERIRQLEFALEREFQEGAVVSVRRFVERVDDQLVTIFGAQALGARSDVGHYLVGSVGAVDADGWGVKVASDTTKRFRGSVDYTLTRARWAPDALAALTLGSFSPSAVRSEREDVHDVAMSGEADILETATRVFFYYRVSNGYAQADEAVQPALGGRFDFQVRQGLPFIPLRGSEWQVLVGIRDLFRDPLESSSSTFDELLVVRPPKRVIGGVQVKF